jgi:3'(2'), 5'-bisphosphate nucleotidase
MGTKHEQELAAGLEAVRQAARVCQSVQAKIGGDVLEKHDRSPVTVADFASQAVVCRVLQERFPRDPVIGEEDSSELRKPDQRPFLDLVGNELAALGVPGGEDDICGWIDRGGHGAFCERFWTLDPIDGTKGFLRKEQYAVALALIVDGAIEVAILGCPNLACGDAWDRERGCVFSAVRGEGSWLWPLADGRARPQRVRVSSTSRGEFARLCESVESGHSAHDDSARVAGTLGIASQPVRLDSQAKYGVVARGEADVYLRLPTRKDYREKIWDHAGGVLVVEEAGGKVTDVAGKPLDFTRGRELTENRGVVVTNGRLHEEVLAAVRQAGVR